MCSKRTTRLKRDIIRKQFLRYDKKNNSWQNICFFSNLVQNNRHRDLSFSVKAKLIAGNMDRTVPAMMHSFKLVF